MQERRPVRPRGIHRKAGGISLSFGKSTESAVLQPVNCPSCDARYGLTRARVRPGIRRAHCFRCATVFGIEAEVMLLIGEEALLPAPAPEPAPVPDGFEEFDLAALVAPEPAAPEPDMPMAVHPVLEDLEPIATLDTLEPLAANASLESLEPLAAEGELELASLEELEAATAAIEPETLHQAQDVLSIDDLDGAESEILDTTLVDYPAPPHPESRPTPPAPLPPVPEEPVEAGTATLGGYSSAKDAISKLLGEAPPPAVYRPPSHRSGTTMDVEATLSALESTLGGVTATHPPAPPQPPRVQPLAPTDLPPPAGATMVMSQAELAAAVSTPPPRPAPVPAEATVMLKMPVGGLPQPTMDPNLLKVQMGTELYSNLTMEQLVSLAEQGRLAEYHMVARQFSDNWLEAAKVPGLRPVFERLRKTRLPEPPPSPMETAPIKKSLFGGLFGKT